MFNAELVAQKIKANVAAQIAGDLTWEEFSERNFALWAQVSQGQTNVIGSACAKRHCAVSRCLGD